MALQPIPVEIRQQNTVTFTHPSIHPFINPSIHHLSIHFLGLPRDLRGGTHLTNEVPRKLACEMPKPLQPALFDVAVLAHSESPLSLVFGLWQEASALGEHINVYHIGLVLKK